MKNCDEMVNSLLERREQYITEQKRKKKVITRTATSMCCVCLVALLGFGMWQGGIFNTTPSDQKVDDALYPSIKDNFDESKGESPDNSAAAVASSSTVCASSSTASTVSDESKSEAPDNPAATVASSSTACASSSTASTVSTASSANNKIIVHQIDGLSADRMNICLLEDDFVVMNKAELNEYYGINVFPTVPDDIKEWEDQQLGIYKRNGGTGEVYWDGTVFNYSNEDFSRAVNIEIQKKSLPVCDYGFLEATEEKSIINNVEAAIGQSENGYYYAQFMYHNVGFQLIAEGLTQDEFVSVIASLIK